MSVRDRLASLAALQPARKTRVAAENAAAVPAANRARGFSPALPDGAERLAELLEAKIAENQFGEHLAVTQMVFGAD